MASLIKKGFCNKLTSEFDSRMNQLTASEQQLDAKLKALKIGIASVTGWSPHKLIKDFEKNVDGAMNSLVPALSTFDELAGLANACLFTKNDPMLKKPSTLAKSIKNSVKEEANTTLRSLASAIGAEYNVSSLITALKNQVKDNKLDTTLGQAAQALNCMSAICGTNITSRLTKLQNFLSKYNLSLTGEINIEEILSGEGLAESVVQSIDRVTEKVETVMTNIDKSFDAGVAALKRNLPEEDDDE
jgi:hypothetical protein